MELTGNQKLATDIRDVNVLVSAAAGSGKTSVLTERIVKRIADTASPVDVDRLLVMTFTNAAAAEMRERIRGAIDSRLDEARRSKNADPAYIANLEKQSILVHNAMITTIDGFCKSVITDHFEEVSIDPGFRVADDNECRLIRQDALEECLEAAYEQADPGFLKASEVFSDARSDAGIAGLILPLYGFIMANPEPERFVKECLASYDFSSFEEFKRSEFLRKYEELLMSELSNAKVNITKAMELINEYEKIEPYRAAVEAYDLVIKHILTEIEEGGKLAYDVIREHISKLDPPAFGRISAKGLGDDEAAAKDAVKRLRDAAKSSILTLSEMLAGDLKSAYEHIVATRPHLEALSDLVLEFSAVYDAKKREKNIIDFNDMEHMAVAILKNPKIADIYRHQFDEIYIDEYQDSNMTQEELVLLICRNDPPNVFQVGDVKQSIYRFRQARPDLFLSKYDTYSDTEGSDRRIILNDNFRSRKQVVDAVNEVFSRIMKADLGGIEYDADAALKFGATCYENEEPCAKETYNAELIIGVKDELSAEELEANIIANRIISMIREGFMVYDKGAKITRPASFGDFTILVRSIRKFEPVLREVFSSVGIPLSVTGREGYFGTLEVTTSLAFLSAVDNPYCDIPLATVARSPVGGLSDNDLAVLTAVFGNKVCLYDRIKAAVSDEEGTISEELAGKCEEFVNFLANYAEMAAYTPVHGVLADFLNKHYADHVRCMSRGPQRMANLEMLLTKAEDFGRTSFKGLYRFVQYMDQIKKYEIDDGEAGIASENDDVVKIMTIHASKGLEFPVCFVAGLEKRRNTTDESGRLIWNVNSGFGADHTDIDKRLSITTLPKIYVKQMNRLDAIAEEMRVLYVAMTRAREKLIMVGCDKEDAFDAEPKSPGNCSSYLDMIKSARSGEGYNSIDVTFVTEQDLVCDRFTEEIRAENQSDQILGIVREYENNHRDSKVHKQEVQTDIPDFLRRVNEAYPYPVYPDLKAKLSVSELKHRAIDELLEQQAELAPEGERLFGETRPDKYIPKFMRAEGETSTGGTFYGTAFHRIMELWDYTYVQITPDEVTSFADKMYGLHRMDPDQVRAIRPEDVACFLNSTLARRMYRAKTNNTLYREQPFVIGISDPAGSGETILVQGIIDAYFVEDGNIVIVDYKTDSVTDEKMLIDRYRTQLEYYGKALTQITGMPVRELIIYSTRLRRQIVLT